MKTEKTLSMRTHARLAANISYHVDTMLDYQHRLDHRVIQDLVNMQTEAYRLMFKIQQIADGTYKPEPVKFRQRLRKDGQPDRRRGCKGGPAARLRK